MDYHLLSPNTQAILLLCASFGQNRQTEPKPLTLSEYNTVASWLLENDMIPEDLLDQTLKNRLSQITIGKLESHRLVALLERGVMLGLAVEKWTNQGLWILGRGDALYPQYLKQRLNHNAPAILYGIGTRELLSQAGLAIVGSRDVDQEGLNYTERVVQTCAEQGINVISGGARGVDQASMLGILAAGGNAVGVLADSLTKAAVASKYRAGIKEGRLTLVSAYDPDASFSAGNAMGRNKYIYALADYALVISSAVGKGGTWAGATEVLRQVKDVPVFVRMQGTVPEGNHKLLEKGGIVFPEAPWNKPLRTILDAAIAEAEESKVDGGVIESEKSSAGDDLGGDKTISINLPAKDIYEAVLPFILNQLEQPQDAKSLAESLQVRKGQMEDWLKRAVQEGNVIKQKNPVMYVANKELNLLTLLEKEDSG
ncbi:DNA-processing protein DprA [Coleofasciculus sp.]|uniref:DNA-processing protein DprA n=1 Tax=Coleofasciculus sp. TaxID=3100458 RepID=UPI0039F8E561